MKIMVGIMTCSYMALHHLSLVPYVLAGDNTTSQPYPGCWWDGAHWHSFWWVFPLMFLIVIVIFMMMRKSGMSCMWCNRIIGSPGSHEEMSQSQGEPSESAMEILNKRYARGEIDKQEYEEKKAAIALSE